MPGRMMIQALYKVNISADVLSKFNGVFINSEVRRQEGQGGRSYYQHPRDPLLKPRPGSVMVMTTPAVTGSSDPWQGSPKNFLVMSVLTNGGTKAKEPAVCTARSRLQLGCTLTPAACAARSARSVPGQDTRSGQGTLARRHTDGPLWVALLKTTVMCEAWRRRTIAPPDPSRTAERPNPILLITGSSIPIPVPGQYRLSLCLK
jgi:hypothetical protein